MQWLFSDLHTYSQLGFPDTTNILSLGFSASPQPQVFSQKFPGSTIRSVSEAVWRHREHWPSTFDNIRTIAIHTVHGIVTLDGVIGLYILSEPSPSKHASYMEALVDAASEAESGKIPKRFDTSLMGWFAATAHMIFRSQESHDESSQLNRVLISRSHQFLNLSKRLFFEGRTIDFDYIMEHPEIKETCEPQRNIITTDAAKYWNIDVPQSKRFVADLPMHMSDTTRESRKRVLGIATQDPHSSFFRIFARTGQMKPEHLPDLDFPLIYIHQSHLKGLVHEHVISVNPEKHCHLLEISSALEVLEDKVRSQDVRPRNEPRPGYAYNDPWYDARHSDGSIIDTPGDGSRLERDDILDLVGYWTSPSRFLVCESFNCRFSFPKKKAKEQLLAGVRAGFSKETKDSISPGRALVRESVLPEVMKHLRTDRIGMHLRKRTVHFWSHERVSLAFVIWFLTWLRELTQDNLSGGRLTLRHLYDQTLNEPANVSLVSRYLRQCESMDWEWLSGPSDGSQPSMTYLSALTE